MTALAGVRVLDVGHYIAGPLAAMLLGEQGADVVHVAPPGGERWANRSNAFLHRGKRVVELDLGSAEDLATARRLAARADVIIDNFRPGVLARLGLGLDFDPDRQIWLSLPGFAPGDPRAGVRAWEGIVGAATGLFTDVHVSRQFVGLPPLFTELPLPSVYAGVHGATAVMAALVRRARGGGGGRIQVPLADAMFHAMGGVVMSVPSQPARYDIPPVPRWVRDIVMPVVRALVRRSEAAASWAARFSERLLPPLMDSYRASDGRLVYLFAMDHDAIPARLAACLGIAAELATAGFVTMAPSHTAARGRNLADAARLTRRKRERLRAILARAIRARPAQEWELVLNEAGVPSAVQRSSAEWFAWESVLASRLVVPHDDPRLGTLMVPGRSVCVGEAPFVSRAQAVVAPEHVPSIWPTSPLASTPPTFRGLPLEGFEVVDLASMIAGPVAARTLAQYGARVWKVDAVAPHHGPRLTRWYGIEVNQGKEPVVLDLHAPTDRAGFQALLAKSDVLLHNLRAPAAASCGIDASVLATLPRLVVGTVSAYGGERPGRLDGWPGYDPVLQAATGIMTRYGSTERPELHALASCIDYLSGDLLAFGTLVALFARLTTPGARALRVRTSLARGAGLVQAVPVLGGQANLAQGPTATHGSPADRIFATRDGHLYAVVPGAALDGLGGVETAARRWAGLDGHAAVTDIEGAGGVAHMVVSARMASSLRVGDDDLDLVTAPSLIVRTSAHPAGGDVTTVFPAHVRGTPVLSRPLSPARRPGESQARAAAFVDRPELTRAPDESEPYLPR